MSGCKGFEASLEKLSLQEAPLLILHSRTASELLFRDFVPGSIPGITWIKTGPAIVFFQMKKPVFNKEVIMNCSKYRKVVAGIFVASLFSAFLAAADRDCDAVADKIVNYSLKVQPGESVLIVGTPAEQDLLGALVVAVYKAGGLPTVELYIPEAHHRALKEMPIEYLTFVPTYRLMQERTLDCLISVTSNQQPGLFADIPGEMWKAIRKSNMPLTQARKNARFRDVELGGAGGIPTEAFARARNADYTEMDAMFWNAVSTDYGDVLEAGEAFSKLMSPHAEVEVTSHAGTNVSFKLGSTPPGLNTGRTGEKSSPSGPDFVFLPAGDIWAAADTSTASGTVVVPEYWFREKKIENLRLNFKDGKLDSVSAANDVSALLEYLESADDGKQVLSVVDIGLNPDSRPLQNSSFYSFEMAGMVTLGIGTNTWAGGDVVSETQMNLLIPDTTVKIGGRTVVSEGKLAVK